MFEHASASNSSMVKRDARIIAQNVFVTAVDSCENESPIPVGMTIACSLRRPADAAAAVAAAASTPLKGSATLPVLVDAQGRLLYGEVSSDRMRARFPSLELVAGEGRGDALIEVVFSMVPAPSSLPGASPLKSQTQSQPAEDDLVQPWIVSFSFTTDQERIERARVVQDELAPLLDELHRYEDAVVSNRATLQQLNANIADLLRHTSGGKLHYYVDEPSQLTQSSASQLVNDLNSKRRQMESSSQIRPAAKRSSPNPAVLAGHDVIGQVVDLAYVDDYNLAFLISWAVQGYLDVVVVKDSETMQRLYDAGVKVMALDQIRPFAVPAGGGASRYRKRGLPAFFSPPL